MRVRFRHQFTSSAWLIDQRTQLTFGAGLAEHGKSLIESAGRQSDRRSQIPRMAARARQPRVGVNWRSTTIRKPQGTLKQSTDGFSRITIDPASMNGQPCIRGMRMTVRRVLEMLPNYPDWASLITDHPELHAEDVAEALRFAAQSLSRGSVEDCRGPADAIPHRKIFEQDPALAPRLLETLLTAAPVGFVFLDRDLRFVRINDQLAEINGVSVEAHLGRTVAEILPTLEPTLLEVTELILATGQPVIDHEFSGETPRAPGITRHWNESWYPVRDDRDEIIGFGGVVVEVTERKQAEAALRLLNQRFELAVKASTAALWQQDLDLRFTWLHNPAPGIDSDAVGKREADLLERAEDVAVIEGLKREVIRSGIGMRTEFSPQIQGVVHCFELLMEPLRDAAGRITGLTGAAIDISERKRAEAAQREIDRNYRALAEASSEIPYRMSADWSTMLPLDGRALYASSDRPLVDWAWLDQYLPPEEHGRVRQIVKDAIARQVLFQMEHCVLRPDGSTGWVRSRAVPILDENEGLVTWFGAASDITERKRIELNLIEATAAA